MSIVTICGDASTTTSVVLAATWPANGAVVIEADRRGGSLASWFDLPAEPSLTDAVTDAADEPLRWCRRTSHGITVLTAPILMREARRAVHDAERSLFPLLAERSDLVALVDAGPVSVDEPPAAVRHADVVVVVHRQRPTGQRAEATRVRRLVELVEWLAAIGSMPSVAVVGGAPFEARSIGRLVAASVPAVTVTHELADDPLTAAVVAGRTGVSARRFARLPLVRTANGLARALSSRIADPLLVTPEPRP